MLRKWRRNMKRRLEDESGKISVKSGLVVSAVLGSAISVLLYTTNISETTYQNNVVLVPATSIISDNNVSVPTQLPEFEIAKHDANTEKDVIEKIEPIMVEQPARAMSEQSAVTNIVGVQDEPTHTSFEQVAQEKAIIAVQEQVLVSEETHNTERLDVVDMTPTNVVEKEQPGQSMPKLLVVREKVIPEKQDEPVTKTVDDSVKGVKPIASLNKTIVKDVSLTTSKQKSEVKISKVDTLGKYSIPIVDKGKLIKSNEKSDSVTIASEVGKDMDGDKPVVSIDKISIVRTEIELGHMPSSEDVIINQQLRVEKKSVVSELIKPNSNENDAHIFEVDRERNQQQITTTPVIAETIIEKDPKQTSTNKQVGTDNSMEDELLTSDSIILQAVNSLPDTYTIMDRSDGVTSMTITPKMNEQVLASTSILSFADITVFQVKNGETSYNGTYYIENSKRGLTMAQRIAEEVRQPSSDSTKVQGTYMTMNWKDNSGGDFFIGFNGSALVVYPLDDEAKAIISDTDSVNNRPIVASSIIESVGSMNINLAQIQSASIYAE